jgi:hypothetical protein
MASAKIRKQDSEPEPETDPGHEPRRFAGPGNQALEKDQRAGNAADEHGEHHRVANLDARIEFDDGVPDGPANNLRVE